MECKLLQCEYRASEDVDYESMPLQCIMFFGLIRYQHAIGMDLVSPKAPKNPDSNDSRTISISFKIKKLFKIFSVWPQRGQTIIVHYCAIQNQKSNTQHCLNYNFLTQKCTNPICRNKKHWKCKSIVVQIMKIDGNIN